MCKTRKGAAEEIIFSAAIDDWSDPQAFVVAGTHIPRVAFINGTGACGVLCLAPGWTIANFDELYARETSTLYVIIRNRELGDDDNVLVPAEVVCGIARRQRVTFRQK